MKQVVPNLNVSHIKKSVLLFFSVFAFAGAIFAQNPDNGGDISGDQTICAGTAPSMITSTAPASGGGTGDIEYLWMFTTNAAATPGGAGYQSIPGSDTENLQPGILYTTTYFVRCARRIGSGNAAFSAESASTVEIDVNEIPNASLNGNPGTSFVGNTIDFSTPFAGPGATYAWDLNGDGVPETFTQNPSFPYNSAGSFDISVTVTLNGCSTTLFGNLTITAPFISTVTDPCGNCGDALNYTIPGNTGFFVHDYILINSNPGESWTLSNPDGVLQNNNGMPFANGTAIPETSPGTYSLDIWFDQSQGGWSTFVTNGTGAGSSNLETGPEANGVTVTCDPCPQAPLPVELVDFKATVKNNKQVELTWVTATETDNSHFEVERSLDGIRFDFVGQREGTGSTTVTTFYNFMDDAAVAGETYYRLKQVDYDGEYTYSDIVSVRIESNEVIVSVTPNPVVDKSIVRLGAEMAPNSILELVSTTGQIVRTYNVPDNATSLELDMTGLAEGIYLLSVGNASRDQKAFYKVVKF